jgi:stage II sporulation protein E
VLECDFELPGITGANSVTKLEFDEIPPFKADFGSYSAAGENSACSGDALENVECSAGERYILLSDGMGSGKRARLDSALSVNLAEHMLRSGLSMTTAQRLINSVMRVKDWEESFATLDFLRLDLFAGRAEFLKSGAAPAYLCRDGGVIKIGCGSYPAGILASCDPDVSSCKLFDGDVLILASDGAPEKAVEKAARLIDERPEASAKQLALAAGSLCKASAYGENSDDITVAVIKISRRNDNLCV